MRYWLAGIAMIVAAGPAMAQDKLLDLTKPAVLAEAMRTAGYKAELKTNKNGEPVIASSTNGSPFSVEFYGCKEKTTNCTSFQFYAYYEKDPLYTIAVANEWNANKRFLKVAIDKDEDFAQMMDFTALGKVTQEAFADMLDWYTVMDGELGAYLKEKRAAAGGKK